MSKADAALLIISVVIVMWMPFIIGCLAHFVPMQLVRWTEGKH